MLQGIFFKEVELYGILSSENTLSDACFLLSDIEFSTAYCIKPIVLQMLVVNL